MTNQRIIGLAILIVSCYFLAGGVFNADAVLRGISGQPLTGFTRNVFRVAYTVMGSVMLVVGGLNLLSA